MTAAAREQLTPSTVEAVCTLARRARSETWTTTAGKGLAPLYVDVGGRIVAMQYGDWLILENGRLAVAHIEEERLV